MYHRFVLWYCRQGTIDMFDALKRTDNTLSPFQDSSSGESDDQLPSNTPTSNSKVDNKRSSPKIGGPTGKQQHFPGKCSLCLLCYVLDIIDSLFETHGPPDGHCTWLTFCWSFVTIFFKFYFLLNTQPRTRPPSNLPPPLLSVWPTQSAPWTPPLLIVPALSPRNREIFSIRYFTRGTNTSRITIITWWIIIVVGRITCRRRRQ